jgi:cyclohexanone monooxygenase
VTVHDQLESDRTLDVLIVGTGLAGLYALYALREAGYRCLAVDRAAGVGGTWYWNRYPGCRIDVEAVDYSYPFDPGLEQEWHWTERYPSQPELRAYLDHVADRFGLRRDIRLETGVERAEYDEETERWHVTLSTGREVSARFLLLATGFVSAPLKPRFEGLESYRGELFHTGAWPFDPVDFTGKRVGIVGTGSSGVQMVPIVARDAAELYVYQRTAGYSVPLRNCPMPAEYEAYVKSIYPQWRRAQWASRTGSSALNWDVAPTELRFWTQATPAERQRVLDLTWENGGLALLLNGFADMVVDGAANEAAGQFVRDKIRARLNDPELEKFLVPSTHPIGTKRLIADTNYYETYAREHVHLRDASQYPIQRFTEHGIVAGGEDVPLDMVILATGFDAVTGAMTRIDLRGRSGIAVAEHWQDGLRTASGIMCSQFPNMFFVDGPGSPSAFYLPTLTAQYQVDWIRDALRYMGKIGASSIEPTSSHEEEFTLRSTEVANKTLLPQANSWYMGANVPGKARVSLCWLGGWPEYRQWLDRARDNQFRGFVFSHAGVAAPALAVAAG